MFGTTETSENHEMESSAHEQSAEDDTEQYFYDSVLINCSFFIVFTAESLRINLNKSGSAKSLMQFVRLDVYCVHCNKKPLIS
jgi:hypothetical protein